MRLVMANSSDVKNNLTSIYSNANNISSALVVAAFCSTSIWNAQNYISICQFSYNSLKYNKLYLCLWLRTIFHVLFHKYINNNANFSVNLSWQDTNEDIPSSMRNVFPKLQHSYTWEIFKWYGPALPKK